MRMWLDETHSAFFLSRFVSFFGGSLYFSLCLSFHLQSNTNVETWCRRRWSTPLLRVTHSEDYEQYNKSEMATGKMLLYSSCLLQMYIPFDSISFTFKAYCYEHFFLLTRPLTPCNFALFSYARLSHTDTCIEPKREKIVQGNLCKLCIVTQRISLFVFCCAHLLVLAKDLALRRQ